MKPSSAGSTGVSESRNRVAFEPSNSVADYDALLTRIPTIDDVLEGHASALGNDRVAYRNHVYRVVNLCVAIVGGRGEVEKIAAAAVFHDLGIWTDRGRLTTPRLRSRSHASTWSPARGRTGSPGPGHPLAYGGKTVSGKRKMVNDGPFGENGHREWLHAD